MSLLSALFIIKVCIFIDIGVYQKNHDYIANVFIGKKNFLF